VAIQQSSLRELKRSVDMTDPTAGFAHPERTEIARYLLSRGLDPIELTPAPVRPPKCWRRRRRSISPLA
jgi:hypothetical protein